MITAGNGDKNSGMCATVCVCVGGGLETCADVQRGRTGMRPGQDRHEEKTCAHACVHVPGWNKSGPLQEFHSRKLQGLGVFFCSWLSLYAPLHTHTQTHTPTLKTHIRSNFIMSGQEYTCSIHENWGMRQLAKTCPQRAEERRESSGEHWLDRRTLEKELRTAAGNTTYYCLLFCELQTSLQAGESWGYQNSLRDKRF